ncbi:MAG: sterol desaturase family protein [Spirochaetia bacterium]|nr:sterol desaturase family protein [Spirochaetia bacterium]
MNETIIRLGSFILLFALFAGAEAIFPRRKRLFSRRLRWPNNFVMVFLGAISGRVFPLFIPVAAALAAEERGFGLFHLVKLPSPLSFILTLLILDLVIYFQHRLFHRMQFLWKIHRMHHTDRDLDSSSALRFHPFEFIISLVIKTGAVWITGASAGSVLVFEVLLNGAAMFNHANIRLPLKADRVIRKILVTPDMHRIHHSIYRKETDSNYGFSLSWWDFIFRSYTDAPRDGQIDMKIGQKGFDDQKHLLFPWMIAVPFFKKG